MAHPMKAAMEVRFESQLRTMLALSERVFGSEFSSGRENSRAGRKRQTNHKRK